MLGVPDRTDAGYLVFVMIDLDNVKPASVVGLNDTYGYAAGDQALAAAGWSLRQHSSKTGIIGRSGGVEFVVADILGAPNAAHIAEPLCAAISAVPHPVTAASAAQPSRCGISATTCGWSSMA